MEGEINYDDVTFDPAEAGVPSSSSTGTSMEDEDMQSEASFPAIPPVRRQRQVETDMSVVRGMASKDFAHDEIGRAPEDLTQIHAQRRKRLCRKTKEDESLRPRKGSALDAGTAEESQETLSRLRDTALANGVSSAEWDVIQRRPFAAVVNLVEALEALQRSSSISSGSSAHV